MSTKIYNGLKLTNMNMQGLKHFASRVREKVEVAHLELHTQVMANICTDIIDNRIITDWCNHKECEIERYGKAAEVRSPIHIAYFSIHDRQRQVKLTQERDPEVDFEFTISILPIRAKLLAIPFTEQSKFLSVLMSMQEVSEYGYWNNSDRPIEVTAKDWKQRRKNWTEALPGIGIPNENGFTINLTHNYMPRANAESVLDYIEPLEKRIEHRARKTVIDMTLKDIRHRTKSNQKEFRAYSAITESMDYLGTPEGKIKLNRFITEYTTIMREITVDDLNSKEKID